MDDKEQNNNSVRLNKFIADCGYCSRRKADELIFNNLVSVNGVIQNSPATKIFASDTVTIHGEKLSKKIEQKIYLMLNKPVQTVCTLHDPQGRKTVIDILPDKYRQTRLFPVGRLDYFSEGLLLLTNDGIFANRLAHPRYNHKKIYDVIIRCMISKDIIDEMGKGIILDDGTTLLPVQVSTKNLKNGKTLLRMTLSQGINREIRRICEKYNITILKLKRISIGSLNIGSLLPGECRELSQNEIKNLLQQK